MNESSLLKRTLIVTGLLVGISATWVGLLSVTVVTIVDRALSPEPRPSPAMMAPPSDSSAHRNPMTISPPTRGTTPNG